MTNADKAKEIIFGETATLENIVVTLLKSKKINSSTARILRIANKDRCWSPRTGYGLSNELNALIVETA